MKKQKREYLPANIRAGLKATDFARVWVEHYGKLPGSLSVEISTFNHGRDVNGNGTAHYTAHLVSDKGALCVVESGKRREQVGYSGMNEAALYALDKLGYKIDTKKHDSYDYHGDAVYPVMNPELLAV